MPCSTTKSLDGISVSLHLRVQVSVVCDWSLLLMIIVSTILCCNLLNGQNKLATKNINNLWSLLFLFSLLALNNKVRSWLTSVSVWEWICFRMRNFILSCLIMPSRNIISTNQLWSIVSSQDMLVLLLNKVVFRRFPLRRWFRFWKKLMGCPNKPQKA